MSYVFQQQQQQQGQQGQPGQPAASSQPAAGSTPQQSQPQSVSQILLTSQGVQNIQVASPSAGTQTAALRPQAGRSPVQYANIQPKPSPIQVYGVPANISGGVRTPATVATTLSHMINTVLTTSAGAVHSNVVTSINPQQISGGKSTMSSVDQQKKQLLNQQQQQQNSLAGLLNMASSEINSQTIASSPILSKAFGFTDSASGSAIDNMSSAEFRSPNPVNASTPQTPVSGGSGKRGKGKQSRGVRGSTETSMMSPRGGKSGGKSIPSPVSSLPPPSPHSVAHSPYGGPHSVGPPVGQPGSVQGPGSVLSLPPHSPHSALGGVQSMPHSPYSNMGKFSKVTYIVLSQTQLEHHKNSIVQ